MYVGLTSHMNCVSDSNRADANLGVFLAAHLDLRSSFLMINNALELDCWTRIDYQKLLLRNFNLRAHYEKEISARLYVQYIKTLEFLIWLGLIYCFLIEWSRWSVKNNATWFGYKSWCHLHFELKRLLAIGCYCFQAVFINYPPLTARTFACRAVR